MSNQVMNNTPTFDCPDFLGEFEDRPSDKYCGTPYCYGASYFEPVWDKDHWSVGFSCSCGCSDEIYVCSNEDEGWEKI